MIISDALSWEKKLHFVKFYIEATNDVISWLETNPYAEKEDYAEQKDELMEVVGTLLQNVQEDFDDEDLLEHEEL